MYSDGEKVILLHKVVESSDNFFDEVKTCHV